MEQCREVFREVFAAGTREERRHFARLFVKKIELEPDTGDILMHLFGRPPLPASKQTPASGETGVRIGLVAGARLVADSDSVPVVTARWLYAGVKQETREMVRVGTEA